MKKFIRKLWHLLPYDFRINISKIYWKNYRKVYSLLMPKPPKGSLDISKHFYIFGFFSSNLSHKTAADLLASELSVKGIAYSKIDISSLHFQTASRIDFRQFPSPKSGDNIIFAINPDILPLIHAKIPKEFLEDKYLIGYWVYELDKLPYEWIISINKMNEIWVPSNFVKKVFAQYSDIKIRVIPHAVGLMNLPVEKYDKNQLRTNYGIKENVFIGFVSFSFSSSMERKNIIGCIKAFEMAFGNDENCILIIRYINNETFPSALGRLNKAVADANCNIKLLSGDALGGGLGALYKLYAMSDILMSLHRSEGFGLQIAEAMRFGLPTIATAYSGNMDFMTNENSLAVDYNLIPVEDPDNIYNLKGAKWAEPDLKMASSLLKKFKNDKSFADNIVNNIEKCLPTLLIGNDDL